MSEKQASMMATRACNDTENDFESVLKAYLHYDYSTEIGTLSFLVLTPTANITNPLFIAPETLEVRFKSGTIIILLQASKSVLTI